MGDPQQSGETPLRLFRPRLCCPLPYSAGPDPTPGTWPPAGPSPRAWLCGPPVRRPSWGWGACPWGGPGCIHLLPGGGSAGPLPSLTACLSLCQPGSEEAVPGGGGSGCGCGPQTLGHWGEGTAGKMRPPPLCGPFGQPMVLALELGTQSGPPCPGRGAAQRPGFGLPLVGGSRLCGDCRACRDCPSGISISALGLPAGCKEGCCWGGRRP